MLHFGFTQLVYSHYLQQPPCGGALVLKLLGWRDVRGATRSWEIVAICTNTLTTGFNRKGKYPQPCLTYCLGSLTWHLQYFYIILRRSDTSNYSMVNLLGVFDRPYPAHWVQAICLGSRCSTADCRVPTPPAQTPLLLAVGPPR